MAENIRTIVTCFLVYMDNKPATIIQDRKQAKQLEKMAESKNRNIFVKEMTIPETRMQEIGENIFTRLKGMNQQMIDRILDVRNKLIRKTFETASEKNVENDVAWISVRRGCGDPIERLTYEEFNRWTLDVAQFVLIKR